MSVMRMMTNKFSHRSNMSFDSKCGNEKIISMIKEQSGSKFIQKKIEEKSPDFLYKLYEQIKPNLIDIINNHMVIMLFKNMLNFVIKRYYL